MLHFSRSTETSLRGYASWGHLNPESSKTPKMFMKCLWKSQFCCMQLCIAKACLELLGLLLQMTSGSSPLPKTSGRRSQSTEQDVHQKAWQLRWKCQMWSNVKWCEAIRTVKHCKKALKQDDFTNSSVSCSNAYIYIYVCIYIYTDT